MIRLSIPILHLYHVYALSSLQFGRLVCLDFKLLQHLVILNGVRDHLTYNGFLYSVSSCQFRFKAEVWSCAVFSEEATALMWVTFLFSSVPYSYVAVWVRGSIFCRHSWERGWWMAYCSSIWSIIQSCVTANDLVSRKQRTFYTARGRPGNKIYLGSVRWCVPAWLFDTARAWLEFLASPFVPGWWSTELYGRRSKFRTTS